MHLNSILLIEDDYDTLVFLKLLLKEKFDLTISESTTNFYKLLSYKQYEAIIVDPSLNRQQNALQLIKDFRKNSAYREIPIIYLSASVLESDKKNAFNAGANVFLRKPIDNNHLLRKLDIFTSSVTVEY